MEQWDERRESDPQAPARAACRSMAKHVEYLLRFKAMGLPVFDYGNNLRQVAMDAGVARAFDFPGFVPAYIRPLFCRGIGPFRWAALSGRSRGHLQDRREGQGADPGRSASASLARHGALANSISGPAGAHLLGGPRTAPPPRPRLQRDGRERRALRARSSSAAITWTRVRWRARTARRRRCRTAPTRSPTGRCSMRC